MDAKEEKRPANMKAAFILVFIALVITILLNCYDFYNVYANIGSFEDIILAKEFIQIETLTIANAVISLSVAIGLLISAHMLKSRIFDFKALGILVSIVFLIPGVHGFFISPFYAKEFTEFWVSIGIAILFSLVGLVLLILVLSLNQDRLHKVYEAVEITHILHIVFVSAGVIETIVNLCISKTLVIPDLVVIFVNVLYLIASFFMFKYLSKFRNDVVKPLHHSHRK